MISPVIDNNRWNIDENQSKVNGPMRKHLLIAGLILAFEAWLGIGLFGMPVGFFCVVVFVILAVSEKERRSQNFKMAGVYALLFVATLVLLLSTVRVAQRRAIPVISAVNRYHSERGHYPQALGELVPAYLPSIPHAGFTRISRNFYYYDGRPQLYFAAMFHGVFAFDFPTQQWRTND